MWDTTDLYVSNKQSYSMSLIVSCLLHFQKKRQKICPAKSNSISLSMGLIWQIQKCLTFTFAFCYLDDNAMTMFVTHGPAYIYL
jgi:hypothetical protein